VVAWLGGLAFVGALAYLGYFYAVILGRPGAEGGDIVANASINTTIFALFAAHHSVFARTRVKNAVVSVVPAALERSVYVWLSSVLLCVVCAAWRPLPGTVYEAAGWIRVALYGIQALGLVFVWRGASVVDALELAGIRQAALQRAPRAEALRTTGPFAIVRHPIYLGWVALVFATPAMTANRLLFATLSSAYIILAIPWEERSLVAAHGDRYRAYQRSVRWRLLPGVW
jgi:protein-S-isoprenylcysteine O-methyltransferase Ste14